MKHYNEHTLDLFVLGDPTVASERAAIERHVAVCFGCREITRELQEFYAATNDSAKLLSEKASDASSKSIVLSPLYRQGNSDFRDAALSPKRIAAMWQFVKRRPAASFFSGLGMIALVLLALNTPSLLKDTRPALIKGNDKLERMEVFNREGDLLWRLPFVYPASLRIQEAQTSTESADIADLSHDGQTEVVAFGVLPEDLIFHNPKLMVLRANGDELWTKTFSDGFQFRGEQYPGTFDSRGIQVVTLPQLKSTELLVGMSNSHSPYRIVRLSSKGDVLGEYWHFGHLGGSSTIPWPGTDQHNVLLCGSDDIHNRGVIVVLDISRLNGKQESTVTPGFGFTTSSAEIYYIRLPLADMEIAGQTRPIVRSITYRTSDSYGFSYQSMNSDNTIQIYLDYQFSKDFRLVSIKSSDSAEEAHAKLLKEGRIKSTLNNVYFDRLKEGVRYWNGRSWLKEPTKVRVDIATK